MAANISSWKAVCNRIDEKRIEAGLTWNELSKRSRVPVSMWMMGLTFLTHPTEDEIRRIAPVVNSTYAYLRFGIEDIYDVDFLRGYKA